MARIILTATDCEFVVETTTTDNNEAKDAQGALWTLKERPTNLPGEVWENEQGETAWRK